METFQEVFRSVPVVADAQSIGANRTLLNSLSAGIAKEVVQFASKATVVIHCQLNVVKIMRRGFHRQVATASQINSAHVFHRSHTRL